MRHVPPGSVFTLDELLAAGWTVSALRNAVARGRLVRIRRGVYSLPGSAGPRTDDCAAALAYPGVPLSHLSAAARHGYPIVGREQTRSEMTVAPRANGDLTGIYVYRARLREHDTEAVDGLLITSPARTLLDVARHYPAITSVPMIDHVLHERLASADELRDVLEFCRTWPGAPRARRAVRLSDSRAESPLESVSRLVIPRLKLPAPEPQVIILDEQGRQIARSDFYWDEFGAVGEADGLSKYTDATVMIAEKEREADLHDTELKVTRWTWRRIWFEQPRLRRRLLSCFESGRTRDRSNVARRWTAINTERIVVL